MKKTYDVLSGKEEDYRGFAKAYIQRRLAENKRDAIEELSAYLGNWMWVKQRMKKALEPVT